MGRGAASRAAAADRYEKFTRMLDEGTLLVDVARELGIDMSTAHRYYRSYRQLRGIGAKNNMARAAGKGV